MLSRFRRQVRGLAGNREGFGSSAGGVCRQPSARAEIHSPPGPTGFSLDRAPLPASSFCHHFQHLECSYKPHTQFSEFTKRNPNAACDRETRNQSREHDGEPFVHDHSLAFFAPASARGPPEAPCAAQQCGNGAPAPLVSVSTDFPNGYGWLEGRFGEISRSTYR